jgi:hypothetical protein
MTMSRDCFVPLTFILSHGGERRKIEEGGDKGRGV